MGLDRRTNCQFIDSCVNGASGYTCANTNIGCSWSCTDGEGSINNCIDAIEALGVSDQRLDTIKSQRYLEMANLVLDGILGYL